MTVIRSGRISFYAQSDVTCYLLHGTGGDLLIDTGLPQTFRGMQKWLCNADLKYVFLTHAHPDHDWNAAKLQRTGAKLLLSVHDMELRRNFVMQRVMPTADRYRLRNIVQNVGGRFCKSPPYEPDICIGDADGGLLRTLGFDAEIIPLPGHTYGSLGILSRGILCCGDAFTALGHKPDITPHAVSPALMRQSLQTILRLDPQWLACGHGLPVRMRDARPVIESYLR